MTFRITAHPDSQMVEKGTKQSFSLAASGGEAELRAVASVQWSCHNDPEWRRRGGNAVFSGPKTTGPGGWRDAEWGLVGSHWIVAHIVMTDGSERQVSRPAHVLPEGGGRGWTEAAMEKLEEHFRITADPPLRTVTPDQKMTFRVECSHPDPQLMSAVKRVRWFCANDPDPETRADRGTWSGAFVGPSENSAVWKNAEWEFPGHHRIVAVVEMDGIRLDLEYPVHVIRFNEMIERTPVVTEEPGAPEAVERQLARMIELTRAIEKNHPAPADKAEAYEARMKGKAEYREKLRTLLNGTRGIERFPIHAAYYSVHNARPGSGVQSGWMPLNVFLGRRANGTWTLVDWTNPLSPRTSGEYDGLFDGGHSSPVAALQAWDADNTYPEGAIKLHYGSDARALPLRPMPGPKLAWKDSSATHTTRWDFETDGTSRADEARSILDYIAIGAAVVAGVVTLVAPVPGSRVVSAAIWTSIFSSTAAATIGFAQRREQGLEMGRADLMDGLTIAANLLGAGAIKMAGGQVAAWQRGATVVSSRLAITRGLLVGSFTADAIQGIVVAEGAFENLRKIMDDPTLAPDEKLAALAAEVSGLAVAGALVYVNMRGTRADLENMQLPNRKLPPEDVPAERLRKLGTEGEEVNLDLGARTEGTTADARTTTTAQTHPRVARRMSTAEAADFLAEAERRELEKLRKLTGGKRKKYGPAHATLVDRGHLDANGNPKVFTGRNMGDAFDPETLHPTLARRREAYMADDPAWKSRRGTDADGKPDGSGTYDGDPGHHGEVQAVNDALRAREAGPIPPRGSKEWTEMADRGEEAMKDMLVSVRSVGAKASGVGAQFGCCNNCARMLTTRGGKNSVGFTPTQAQANGLPEGQRRIP